MSRRVSILEHPLEHRISIGAAVIGAQRRILVHPCKDDDATFEVKTEEQPILLKELRPKPVPIRVAQSVALPELRVSWVGRDLFKDQLGNRSKPLRDILAAITGWVCFEDVTFSINSAT